MTTSLSHRLRADTSDLHRLAERSGIMHGLLRGHLDRGEYVDLLRGLHVVYAMLEARLDALAEDDTVRAIHDRALFRSDALASDLAALHGEEWTSDIPPLAAAVQYADRIRDASPRQLVAHAYVRYMGDLSGGQALGRVIARALALPGEAGISFYQFPAIPDADRYKEAFRAALDSLPLDGNEVDDVVREAQEAFRLNVRVFEEAGRQSAPSGAPPQPPAA